MLDEIVNICKVDEGAEDEEEVEVEVTSDEVEIDQGPQEWFGNLRTNSRPKPYCLLKFRLKSSRKSTSPPKS